ncbi:MAG: PQQ-dependent sugar dehydrogenase [Betaproteobacteria bacterium]|nr:PQQ-dependent sugar dehydrogenase [Betaproteobacteria bacterium]
MGATLLLAGLAPAVATTQSKDVIRPAVSVSGYSVKLLAEGLQHPWGLAWLPSGEILITEREGSLRRLSRDFSRLSPPFSGLPASLVVEGQGGLLDIAVHPEFSKNGWIYLSYAEAQEPRGAGIGTALLRARLKEDRLVDIERLFSMQPKSRGGRHFGGRIVFDQQGMVYLTLGDRGEEERAQRPNDHAGSVIRLHDDGRIPVDNPFRGRPGQMAEVFSRGNRNIQGAAIHPVTGALWTHEHGPQGGDEVNIIRGGRNYGWPTVTYGVNYVTGTRIGEGTHKAGMEPPLHVWTPSIAPSGMAFYFGKVFPQWHGSLFVGALRGQSLVRLVLDGERVIAEERLLVNQIGRIRDVRVGPDGLIYLLTDAPDGKLFRIEPR